jgi:hypothetical protein
MASFSFWGAETGSINLNGSGLGFFGSTFGNSVTVGGWQDSTYITDGNGTVQGAQVNNVKWVHPNSGLVDGVGPYALNTIPNRFATLKARFNHSTLVKLQNTKLRIYDRTSISNAASGVTTKVAQLIHPNPNQAAAAGSGDSSWNTPAGSAVIMTVNGSPGLSGYSPNGTNTYDYNHDFYFAVSQSPDSVGSKVLNGLYIETEYL